MKRKTEVGTEKSVLSEKLTAVIAHTGKKNQRNFYNDLMFFQVSGSQPVGVERWPFHKGYLKPAENTFIYITSHKIAKLQLWNSNENNFMVGDNNNMYDCIKGLQC